MPLECSHQYIFFMPVMCKITDYFFIISFVNHYATSGREFSLIKTTIIETVSRKRWPHNSLITKKMVSSKYCDRYIREIIKTKDPNKSSQCRAMQFYNTCMKKKDLRLVSLQLSLTNQRRDVSLS